MRFFDVHTHVSFAAFQNDYKEVIARALEKDIWMVNVGTQKDTSAASIKLANEYGTGVWATVGLHPIHTEKSFHDEEELGAALEKGEPRLGGFWSRREDFEYEVYKKLALDPKVVAIGECGLDYYRLQEESKIKQKKVFEKQIELSGEIKKPLMIHSREAFGDLIEILNSNRNSLNSKCGIIHFFSGTKDDAKRLMDLGFSFSFGGVITFPPRLAERSRGEVGAREYEKLVDYIPLDRILLETDAPYVAPLPHRGKRNEPSYVTEVANKISKIKGISLEEVAETTFQNALEILSIAA